MTGAERAVAEALWHHVEEEFGADKAHEALIEHCRSCGDLAFAAQRYRRRREAIAEVRPEEAEAIDKRLAAIAAVAMSQLGSLPAGPPPGRLLRRVLLIAGAVFFAAAVGLLLAALRM